MAYFYCCTAPKNSPQQWKEEFQILVDRKLEVKSTVSMNTWIVDNFSIIHGLLFLPLDFISFLLNFSSFFLSDGLPSREFIVIIYCFLNKK